MAAHEVSYWLRDLQAQIQPIGEILQPARNSFPDVGTRKSDTILHNASHLIAILPRLVRHELRDRRWREWSFWEIATRILVDIKLTLRCIAVHMATDCKSTLTIEYRRPKGTNSAHYQLPNSVSEKHAMEIETLAFF